jgi:hypothetical protein
MSDVTANRTRRSKRDQIRDFFVANIGKCFSTAQLHAQFGTAFRTRVSDLNKDQDCLIFIRNIVQRSAHGERSWYYAEWRSSPQSPQPQQPVIPSTDTFPEFGDLTPEPRWPD